jgi:putative ABC transport system substrate-binding protein
MHDLGWSEGRDTEIDVRFAAGDADRARAYWAELIRSAPDVILANSAIVVAALKQQTTTILLHCTRLLFRTKAASCWLLA